MKRVFSLLMSAMVLLTVCITAFASETKTPFEMYAADVEGYVKGIRSDTIPTSEKVKMFIAEHGAEYDVAALRNSNEVKEITLTNGDVIILDGIFMYVNGCEEVDATQERRLKGALVSQISSKKDDKATKGTTPIKSYYHAVYALVLGQELYRITQEAQFTYTGSSVTCNYSDGYYQRGFLSIWQVSDFTNSAKSNITENGVYYERVKSSANFHYGLEINGIGLIIQDNYCWVDARCTKNGVISGYMDADHNIH